MDTIFVPDHIHFLATVTLEKPRFSEQGVGDWLTRLVKAVDMEILSGPFVCICDDPGNEGITGIVILSTSHSTIRIWDQAAVPYMKMDLYSCKRFKVATIIDMIGELRPRVCEYQLIDRNHTDEDEVLIGSMFRITHGSIDYRGRSYSHDATRRSPA